MNMVKAIQKKSQPEKNNFLASGILQRKCACGQHKPGGGECAECSNKKKLNQSLQAKLRIGEANDRYEQEADRVAEQVMRTPNPKNSDANGYLQTKPLIQRRATNTRSDVAGVPSSVHDVLRSPGKPLDQTTRDLMEPRFGHDFSGVKIHTDAKASESAHSVNALAYTVGNDIVLRSDQYNPQSNSGRKLLAHELAHTIQQGNNDRIAPQKLEIGPGNSPLEKNDDLMAEKVLSDNFSSSISFAKALPSIQRACGPPEIGSVGGCVGVGNQDIADFGFSSGDIYRFVRGCDVLIPGEEARLRGFVASISPGEEVEIHGFSSEEGDATFNENLSCARAHTAAGILGEEGVTASVTEFKHGATPGLREDRRAVAFVVNKPEPVPEPVTKPVPVPEPVPEPTTLLDITIQCLKDLGFPNLIARAAVIAACLTPIIGVFLGPEAIPPVAGTVWLCLKITGIVLGITSVIQLITCVIARKFG